MADISFTLGNTEYPLLGIVVYTLILMVIQFFITLSGKSRKMRLAMMGLNTIVCGFVLVAEVLENVAEDTGLGMMQAVFIFLVWTCIMILLMLADIIGYKLLEKLHKIAKDK